MSYFTLNHGYNWCYYYELVFFSPSKNKKDLVEGVVWLSLTFLVQEKEQNADKEGGGQTERHCLWADMWILFLSAWDMTDVPCPWKESFLSSSFSLKQMGVMEETD